MVSRPLVAVSLKTYFGQGQTLEWVKSAAEASRPWLEAVDVLVAPMATALVETVKAVAGGGVALVGAQDCSWTSPGPYTGELPASVLREVGVSVVELGHAERRSLFGEDDLVIARKAATAAREGLVPMVCVGERSTYPRWQPQGPASPRSMRPSPRCRRLSQSSLPMNRSGRSEPTPLQVPGTSDRSATRFRSAFTSAGRAPG